MNDPAGREREGGHRSDPAEEKGSEIRHGRCRMECERWKNAEEMARSCKPVDHSKSEDGMNVSGVTTALRMTRIRDGVVADVHVRMDMRFVSMAMGVTMNDHQSTLPNGPQAQHYQEDADR